MDGIIYICLLFLLIFGILAVTGRSILKSAIFLALASAALAVIMYILGAPWAAVFEVSVCSGLITVIFISAISLSRMKKEEVQKLYSDKKRMAYLPAVLILGGVGLIAVAYISDFTLTITPNVAEEFRDIFWNSRQSDILGQIAAILAGGIAIAVLFKENEEKK